MTEVTQELRLSTTNLYREAQARQIQNGASVSALFGGGTARYHTHGFSFTSRTPDLFAQSEGADVQDITRVFIIVSYQMVNNDFIFHFSRHQSVSGPRILYPLLVPPAVRKLSPFCQLLWSTV